MAPDVDLHDVDNLGAVGSLWRKVRAAAALVTLTGMAGDVAVLAESVAGVDPGELTGAPGLEWVLALRLVHDAAVSGEYDRVIVDLSGGPDPLDVLQTPALVSDHLERAWPRHRRLAAEAQRALATAVDAVDTDCRELADLLVGGVARVHLVGLPDDRGAHVVPRQLAVLALLGLPVADVRLIGGERTEICAAADGVGVPVLVTAAPDVPVAFDDGPVPVRVGPSAASVEHLGGDGLESRFAMAWAAPLPDPASLQLGRSGDDLMVTVCGVRERVRLPSVLRRCVVTGAAWADSRLTITFSPNPKVWPT